MVKNIFITYNENSDIGQNTALRLQTISSLYGYSVSLPVRYAAQNKLHPETRQRITNCSIVIAFSLEKLTPIMKEELKFGASTSKPIIILYDKSNGKIQVDFENYKNWTAIPIEFNDTEKSLKKVVKFLETIPARSAERENSATEAIVSIGLGLLALWLISKNT